MQHTINLFSPQLINLLKIQISKLLTLHVYFYVAFTIRLKESALITYNHGAVNIFSISLGKDHK